MSDDERPAYFVLSGEYGTKPKYEVHAGVAYTPRQIGFGIEFNWLDGLGVTMQVLCWYVFVERRRVMHAIGEGGRIL